MKPLDLPYPAEGGVPWIVYPNEGRDCGPQKFFSIADGQIEYCSFPHFRHAACELSAYGWILFRKWRSGKLYLFNPSTSKRLPLPRFPGEDIYTHVFSTTPDDPDCFIVAYSENHPFILYAPPKGKKWEKLKLNIGEDCVLRGATSFNKKVYFYTGEEELLIIQFSPCPVVQCLITKRGYAGRAFGEVGSVTDVVASSTNLFLVDLQSCLATKINFGLFVSRLDFTSMTWEPVKSIDGLVFIIGLKFTSSIPSCNTKLKGNCIYLLTKDLFHCFDMEFGSFTVSYPSPNAVYTFCEPFWLELELAGVNQQLEENHIVVESKSFVSSYEQFLFNHPKYLLADYLISRDHGIWKTSTCLPSWCPRAPLLMFTHKNDGLYKILDPCSKIVYEHHHPRLSGSLTHSSKGGWLIVENPYDEIFFYNPFTRKRVTFPPEFGGAYGVAFLNRPTSSNYTIFFISEMKNDSSIVISVYHCGDSEWATRKFENSSHFELSHSNPIYVKGFFYCLGRNGSLGVYNLVRKIWGVLRAPVDVPRKCYNCALVESSGKLLSMFIDLFEKPVGIFEFDMKFFRWKKVSDLGDNTFFFGQGASFCVTAPSESMKNMIYFPTFKSECSFDLVSYSASDVSDLSFCTEPKTGYPRHVWIEPTKNFQFELLGDGTSRRSVFYHRKV